RWAAVPLIALCGNLHAGAVFPAGVAGLFFLEAWWKTRDWRELAGAAAAGLAVLGDPGGAYNLHYLISCLNVQDVLPLREYGPPRAGGNARASRCRRVGGRARGGADPLRRAAGHARSRAEIRRGRAPGARRAVPGGGGSRRAALQFLRRRGLPGVRAAAGAGVP